ncbi:decaprenyl-phosphate phosphoribosyltransferase [soil metagenome]
MADPCYPSCPLLEYLRIWRIDHWLKNIFIIFGHAAALVLVLGFDPPAHGMEWSEFLSKAALSLVPACFIASANYILNEILDAPFDAMHPTKRNRGIPAGKVAVPFLWFHMAILVVVGFGLAWMWFPNIGYLEALALLLVSGFIYNVPPVRLKDRAYLDVIAESFNNPIRLWLGWFAVVPPAPYEGPLQALLAVPLSIVLAWWFFGALLMTGKRYAEFRFIDDAELSGRYRKSFRTYTQRRLIMAMVMYACLFCFCAGIAMATRAPLSNLVFVFPMILVALYAYFNHAMSEVGARLEPEQLLQNKWIILATAATSGLALWLLTTDLPLLEWTGFLGRRP